MFKWLANLLKRDPVIEHFTVDGGHSAPHPGMTDSDLYDFESDSLTGTWPSLRTWPSLTAYIDYCNMQDEVDDAEEQLVEGLRRYDENKGDDQAWVNLTKIVVPTAFDKVQILLALRYIHDLRCIDTDYMAVNTLVHQYAFPERIEVEAPVCPLAPPQWLCSRTPGHDGPCAAWPL